MYLDAAEEKMLRAIVHSAIASAAAGCPFAGEFRHYRISATCLQVNERGIARVEVRFDDGPWQEARMSRPISNATWVQWQADWTASAGRHAIEVRSTDGLGDVQTAEPSDPAPDGARGHHRISVTAS